MKNFITFMENDYDERNNSTSVLDIGHIDVIYKQIFHVYFEDYHTKCTFICDLCQFVP